MPRTGLLVEVPEAEPLVERWRQRYDPVAARGVPAHVTTLFPFRLDADLDELAVIASSFRQFSFELREVDAFPDAVILRPVPDAPFRALTNRLWYSYPDCPPYEGRHADVQPHITVAVSTPEAVSARRAEIFADLDRQLPITCQAAALCLYASDETGRWARIRRFPFAPA